MRRALFLGIPLALFSAACTYDNGDAHRVLDQTPTCGGATTPVQASIDVGAEVEVDPGQGAGVFVEYAAGGHWRLRTSCDTSKNSVPCSWDIIVTPEDGRSISNVVAEDLESGSDAVRAYPPDPRSYQLVAETSGDIDGFSFDTEVGTAVSVDSYLDGSCALPYFFWVGDGALHTGSPSNPLVLIPTPE